jgi:hypothetical protein
MHFISPRLHRGLYDAVLQALAALGLEPSICGHYDSPRTLWTCVANGAGWTVTTRNRRYARPPGLVAIPIRGFRVPWGFQLHWRTAERSLVVRGAIQALMRVAWSSVRAQ